MTAVDKVAVGDEREPFVDSPLTIADFVRYQGASGDFNPIHYDTEFAAKAGYPTPFAVGMLQAGIMSTYVTDWLGPANIRRIRFQFREQAWPGDVLTYSAKVVGEATIVDGEPDAGERTVDLEMTATRQTGGLHLKAWATFVN